MVLAEDAVRIVSGLAALMLVMAGVLALHSFRIPGAILSFVRGFYAILWPLPVLSLVLFATLVVRARWILGFWPYPSSFDLSRGPGPEAYTPSALDPKAMPIHAFSAYVVLLLAAFAILWAVPAYTLLRASGRRPHPASLSILVAGSVMLYLLPLCDPGRFFSWFVD